MQGGASGHPLRGNIDQTNSGTVPHHDKTTCSPYDDTELIAQYMTSMAENISDHSGGGLVAYGKEGRFSKTESKSKTRKQKPNYPQHELPPSSDALFPLQSSSSGPSRAISSDARRGPLESNWQPLEIAGLSNRMRWSQNKSLPPICHSQSAHELPYLSPTMKGPAQQNSTAANTISAGTSPSLANLLERSPILSHSGLPHSAPQSAAYAQPQRDVFPHSSFEEILQANHDEYTYRDNQSANDSPVFSHRNSNSEAQQRYVSQIKSRTDAAAAAEKHKRAQSTGPPTKVCGNMRRDVRTLPKHKRGKQSRRNSTSTSSSTNEYASYTYQPFPLPQYDYQYDYNPQKPLHSSVSHVPQQLAQQQLAQQQPNTAAQYSSAQYSSAQYEQYYDEYEYPSSSVPYQSAPYAGGVSPQYEQLPQYTYDEQYVMPTKKFKQREPKAKPVSTTEQHPSAKLTYASFTTGADKFAYPDPSPNLKRKSKGGGHHKKGSSRTFEALSSGPVPIALSTSASGIMPLGDGISEKLERPPGGWFWSMFSIDDGMESAESEDAEMEEVGGNEGSRSRSLRPKARAAKPVFERSAEELEDDEDEDEDYKDDDVDMAAAMEGSDSGSKRTRRNSNGQKKDLFKVSATAIDNSWTIPIQLCQPPLYNIIPAYPQALESDPAPRTKKVSKYTPEQDQMFLQMKNSGKSWAEIASESGCHNQLAVRNRYQVLIGQQGGGTYTWSKQDCAELQMMLDEGERAKWLMIAQELSRKFERTFTLDVVHYHVCVMFTEQPERFGIIKTKDATKGTAPFKRKTLFEVADGRVVDSCPEMEATYVPYVPPNV